MKYKTVVENLVKTEAKNFVIERIDNKKYNQFTVVGDKPYFRNGDGLAMFSITIMVAIDGNTTSLGVTGLVFEDGEVRFSEIYNQTLQCFIWAATPMQRKTLNIKEFRLI